MVPLIIIGVAPTPRPPATFSSAVGWVGSGKSHFMVKYWALELLIWFCGLKFQFARFAEEALQLASSCERGVARGTKVGLSRATARGAPTVDARKSRLTESAVILVSLERKVMIRRSTEFSLFNPSAIS